MLNLITKQLVCTCRTRSIHVASLSPAPTPSTLPSTSSTSSSKSSLSEFASRRKGRRPKQKQKTAQEVSLHTRLVSRRDSIDASRMSTQKSSLQLPPGRKPTLKIQMPTAWVNGTGTIPTIASIVEAAVKAEKKAAKEPEKPEQLRKLSPEDLILVQTYMALPKKKQEEFKESYWAFRLPQKSPWNKLSIWRRRSFLDMNGVKLSLQHLATQPKRLRQARGFQDNPELANVIAIYEAGVKRQKQEANSFRAAMSQLATATPSLTEIEESLSSQTTDKGLSSSNTPSNKTSPDGPPSPPPRELSADTPTFPPLEQDTPTQDSSLPSNDTEPRDTPPHLDKIGLNLSESMPADKTSSSLADSKPKLKYRELSTYAEALSSTDAVPMPLVPTQPQPPIATLAHGLSRVLYNPGVHFLRDPRSQVYNFPPSLDNLPHVDNFEFGKLPQYTTSSKDKDLMELAEREGKTFVGSTSSTVGMLCQIYFWLSKGKKPNYGMLSQQWHNISKQNERKTAGRRKRQGSNSLNGHEDDFTAGQRMPVSIIMHEKEGRYAIDADKTQDAGSDLDLNILASLGHLMEKLLTTEATEFSRFLKNSNDPAPSQADDRQAYHYATTEHMVLRSQLDATDPHLPRQTFDVKTRGSIAVRHDRLNHAQASGYTVDRLLGSHGSFEREYYDLIRSAFLKYSFQARIGHMDGCFLAYHSTTRFFGFQYIPLEEMYEALFGHEAEGEHVFTLCVGFLEKLLLRVKDTYSGRSLRVTFAADVAQDVLRVFVQPFDILEGEKPETTLLELRGTNYVDGVGVGQVNITAIPMSSRSGPDGPTRIPRWDVGFEIRKYSTSDSSTGPNITALLSKVRESQEQFNRIALPEGVTNADLLAAAKAAQAGEEIPELLAKFPLGAGMEYMDDPTRLVKVLRRFSAESAKRRQARELQDSGKKLVELQTSIKE